MSVNEENTTYEVVERTAHTFEGGTTISTTIVDAVACASGTDPMDLPPLYEHVDLEALDELVAHDVGHPTNTDLTITFSFESYEVSVRGDGEIVVTRSVEAA